MRGDHNLPRFVSFVTKLQVLDSKEERPKGNRNNTRKITPSFTNGQTTIFVDVSDA